MPTTGVKCCLLSGVDPSFVGLEVLTIWRPLFKKKHEHKILLEGPVW